MSRLALRNALLVDSGPLIAGYLETDPYAEAMTEFLESEGENPRFGAWLTVEPVVAESYTFLRRHAGLSPARQFLRDLEERGKPIVLQVRWERVASLLQTERAERLGKGFSFADASLVVAAKELGIEAILTVDRNDFRPFGLQTLP